MIRWSETVALFGGRFDPPHAGHVEALRGLFANPGIREAWVLPTPVPAHKTALAPVEDRVAMARLAFERIPGVRIDLRELARAKSRPTYTFDTLTELRGDLPRLAFVIGADQLATFTSWHRFPELLGLCDWIVLARKPGGESLALETLREWEASGLANATPETGLWQLRRGATHLKLVETGAPDLSSTRIRESIARTGTPPEKSLTPEVSQYLKQRRLYGTVGAETS